MGKRLERAAEILESWAEGQLTPPLPYSGICGNLKLQFRYHSKIVELVSKAAQSWPEFSGNVNYPVPHEHVSPESAFTAEYDVPKWGDDSYGQARRRLCRHVADWIRANPFTAAELLGRG